MEPIYDDVLYDVQQINDWYFVFHQSQKVKTNRASYQAINERVVDVKNKITELADRYQSFHSIRTQTTVLLKA